MNWREKLKDELRGNRTRSKTGGSGEKYWDSVVDTIVRFAQRNPKVDVDEKVCKECKKPIS